MPIRKVIVSTAFAIGLTAGCIPLQFENCSSDEQCVEEFGAGYTCRDDGLCFNHAADVDPADLANCAVMVCDHVINVGNVSAQTGPNENLGQGMVAGIRAAFHEANQAGGIHGRFLNLVVLDDGYEPVNTEPAMRELTTGGDERKVLAIVGNVGTPTAIVAIPVAIENNVVFHGAFTGAGVLRNSPPDQVVFNYRSSYVQETSAMVRYLTSVRDLSEQVPQRNIGVLAQGDTAAAQDESAFDGYGAAGFEGVAQALNGIVPRAEIPIASYERNTSNVDIAVEHFVRWLGGPDSVEENGIVRAAIIMVPTANPTANLIIQMKDAIEAAKGGTDPSGITLTDEERTKLAKADLFFASVSFVGADKLKQNLAEQGNQYCTNVSVTQVVPFPTGSSQGALQYQQALAAYAESITDPLTPGFVSFEGYLAARLFVDGLKNAPTLDTAGLVDGLQSLSNVEYGIGTPLGFGIDDHQASDRVWGTQLDDTCTFQALELEAI